MILDLDAAAEAPDQRPIAPQALVDNGLAKDLAAAGDLADDVADWWTQNLRRELWANTWVARVPGQGIQWLEVPRFPIWDNPPVTSRITESQVNQGAYDAANIRVVGQCRKLLYRERGWPWTVPLLDSVATLPAPGLEHQSILVGPDPDDDAVVGFRAGFLMPAEVIKWTVSIEWEVATPESSTSYGGTEYPWARPATSSSPGLFEVTAGSGVVANEPTWPTVDGESVTQDGVTFTLRLHAEELPRSYVTASFLVAEMIKEVQAGGECDHKGDRRLEALAMVRGAC